ncbi:MAG: arsenate reductase/protein-tyrosine-phosphatase family protein [Kineosporiaceae bacterium]
MNADRRSEIHAALGEPIRLAMVDQLVVGDASPGELALAVGMRSNLLAFHLGVLDQAGVVRRVRSEGDGRRHYVQLQLEDPMVAALTRPVPPQACPESLARALDETRQLVFVCTANSARSQLAAAVWRRLSSIPVTSAGTHPADRLHPGAVAIGLRHGLDLTRARTAELRIPPDHAGTLVVAVCDNAHEELARKGLASPDSCHRPDRTGLRWLHWHVPDPVRSDDDDAFESAYAQVTERVDRLAAVLNHLPRAS